MKKLRVEVLFEQMQAEEQQRRRVQTAFPWAEAGPQEPPRTAGTAVDFATARTHLLTVIDSVLLDVEADASLIAHDQRRACRFCISASACWHKDSDMIREYRSVALRIVKTIRAALTATAPQQKVLPSPPHAGLDGEP